MAGSILFAGHEQDPGNRRVDPHGSFVCSTCHREHRGANFDLQAMSNAMCQACHRERYHSFATDHPEFKNWPNRRRTRIAFDHAAHKAKHFPAEKQEFACRQCHQLSPNGFQRTLGYDASCAKCHNSDIQTSWRSGIDFISLPIIDTQALANAGYKMENWPDAVRGDFDGSLPLLTKFLLLSDDETAKSLDQLGIDFDFFDLDPKDSEQMGAAAKILNELTKFTTELAEKGHDAIQERLTRLAQREITSAELIAAVAHLSSENMSAPALEWLATVEVGPRNNVKSPVSAGGWLRDDEIFTLRYLPASHDDPFMAAWIDMIAAATRGPQSKLAAALLLEMMKPTAPGMCGSCHSVDRDPVGGLIVNWLTKQPAEGKSFTIFSHSPHVLQSQLADCKACHQFTTTADVMTTYTQTNPVEFVAGFQTPTKQDCATCHRPDASGDNCTQCHQYHVTKP
jgi:hypothetical protein